MYFFKSGVGLPVVEAKVGQGQQTVELQVDLKLGSVPVVLFDSLILLEKVEHLQLEKIVPAEKVDPVKLGSDPVALFESLIFFVVATQFKKEKKGMGFITCNYHIEL